MKPIVFEIEKSAAWCAGRVGRVRTPHGSFATPAFMPVGTQGTVKGLLPELVADTGAQIALANTYHLLLRPGAALVAAMGGLQQWTRWSRPMLTDSGGFQVFSLGQLNRIHEDGVTFKSHLNGATIELTPEQSILVQNQLGADIIMAFDDCPPQQPDVEGEEPGVPPATALRTQQAVERTLRWLDRCVTAHRRAGEQGLFGIVQGGTDLELRGYCAREVVRRDLAGYAIGGVAVGETYASMKKVVEHTAPLLPGDRPRYLMGVGYERDIWMAVQAGVDMFDCVLPTRNGRNATAFTPTGRIKLRNAQYATDPRPVDPTCDCPACRGGEGFTRSYLRHLFLAGEMLGPILLSLHNLRHFQRLMLDIRRAIVDNDPSLISRQWPVTLA